MCYRILHVVIQTKCDTMECAGDSTDTDSHARMDELTEKMKVPPFVFFPHCSGQSWRHLMKGIGCSHLVVRFLGI